MPSACAVDDCYYGAGGARGEDDNTDDCRDKGVIDDCVEQQGCK